VCRSAAMRCVSTTSMERGRCVVAVEIAVPGNSVLRGGGLRSVWQEQQDSEIGASQTSLQRTVSAALRSLSSEERQFLRMRYGLDDGKAKSTRCSGRKPVVVDHFIGG
jgi:hypothetical protein